MGALSVFIKDCREHGLALFSLAVGLVAVVILSLAQQRIGEFSMSGFEVVRFALITVLPLIAFILGNRLIVREYTGGTRLFVEGLPLRTATPLIVKCLTGWIYLVLLGGVLIGLATVLAKAAEFIDLRYLLILLLKTSTIITLYWSIVFFGSLTGKLRLLVYLIVGFALLTLFNLPDFDQSRLAPVALMDRQLFVFERDVIPWMQIIQTLGIALVFFIAGFCLAFINEGSAIEQLGKPLSKRNFAAIGLLGFGVFGVYANLQEKRQDNTYEFTGEQVLRNEIPAIEISYLESQYQPVAEKIKTDLVAILSRFLSDTGLADIPKLQIALNTELDSTEIYPRFTEGVMVTVNYTDYNHYEHAMMNTVGLHHQLLLLTNNRWDYETRHWLLDGVARWWVEGGAEAPDSINNPEHFVKAIVALRRIDENIHPLLLWQLITDQYGFEAAGAMAYTALLYLAELQGPDAVVKIAMDYIEEKPGSSSLESMMHLSKSDADRFEKLTDINFNVFTRDWRDWLLSQQTDPAISSLLATVPDIEGEVVSVVDNQGLYWLEASYTAMPNYIEGVGGECVLRHQPASAYDVETEPYEKERDRQPCVVDEIAHRVLTRYSPGDRTYAVLEFENDQITRPIVIWSGRVHIK